MRALIPCVAVAALLSLVPTAGWGQRPQRGGATAPAQPAGPPPPDVLALLDADVERQWTALARLRQNPAGAREGLLRLLRLEEPPPERWRVIYRMVEFGTAEDVPLLLGLRDAARNPWERRVAEGAVRAVYDPVGAVVGLEGVVQDFSFIQTRSPERSEGSRAGKWLLSSWSLADYHRDTVPLAVIHRLQPLRNKAYGSKAELLEAMQDRVGVRDWKALQERLLQSVDSGHAVVTLQGLARVRLANPLDRPLLLSITLDAWYGRLREDFDPAWVYLPPRSAQTVDLPVAPQGAADSGRLRMDLRLAEVDGATIPGFHKLYLPLQP